MIGITGKWAVYLAGAALMAAQGGKLIESSSQLYERGQESDRAGKYARPWPFTRKRSRFGSSQCLRLARPWLGLLDCCEVCASRSRSHASHPVDRKDEIAFRARGRARAATGRPREASSTSVPPSILLMTMNRCSWTAPYRTSRWMISGARSRT